MTLMSFANNALPEFSLTGATMADRSHSRSASPTRHTGTPLHDIPDVSSSPAPTPPAPARAVTPGPNAFAQHAAKVEKHRLASNAFYQQEVARRIVTPPTAVHPASRPGFRLGDTSPDSPPLDLRNSAVTTMSPFVNAEGHMPPTPPLKLTPGDSSHAFPTDRGFIEDKREQLLHEHSGDATERTPVFTYTPKIGASEFSKSVGHDTPKKKKGVLDWVSTAEQQSKSPKKGLLEKLRFTTPRPSQLTSQTSSVGTSRVYGGGEALPPKAKAMLSDSPHNANLGRSPSKRKGLFSRKVSENARSEEKLILAHHSAANKPRSVGALTANFSDSTGKTPQTANTTFSDPTYNRQGHTNRAVSQAHSEQGGDKQQKNNDSCCGVSRSQSLEYFDRTIPPTPPAKNTPPHEKQIKAQQEARRILEHHQMAAEARAKYARNVTPRKEMMQKPLSKLTSPLRGHQRVFEDETPTRETAKLIGADGRISPTKTGTYGRKDMPKLVKQPSVYSLHASYYPDLQDEWSYEEVKKTTDGLGLQGLSELPESFYQREPRIMYSPSVYSTDWSARPSSTAYASPGVLHGTGMFKEPPSRPSIAEHHRPTPSKTSLQTKKSSSSKGSIPIMYPDIASDPSRRNTTDGVKTHHRSTSEIQLPVHSRMHLHGEHYSPSRSSVMGTMAAEAEDVALSPPTYNCPSAMPSPLQFLPAATYTPPPVVKRKEVARSGSQKTLTPSRSRGRIEAWKNAGSPIARKANSSSEKISSVLVKPSSKNISPTSPFANSPFDKLPSLPPNLKPAIISPVVPKSSPQVEPQKKQDRSPSPVSDTVETVTTHEDERMRTPSQSSSDSPVQNMVRRIETQQAEIERLKAEILNMNAQVNRHRAEPPKSPVSSSAADSDVGHAGTPSDVTEDTQTLEKLPSYKPDGSLNQLGLHHRMQQRRVDQEYDAAAVADMNRHEHSDEVIKAAREADTGNNANAVEQIIDIVGGLAQRLKELEENSKR